MSQTSNQNFPNRQPVGSQPEPTLPPPVKEKPGFISSSEFQAIANILMLILALFLAWIFVQWVAGSRMQQPYIFAGLCIGILLRQRWVIYVAITMTIIAMLGDIRFSRDSYFLEARDAVVTLVIMSMLMYSLRSMDMGGIFYSLIGKGKAAKDANRHGEDWIRLRPFTAGIMWIPISLAIGWMILTLIPMDLTANERLRITPTGMRAIVMAWVLAVIWFLATIILDFVSSRKTQPVQARVMARRIFCRELGRDLAAIEKRRNRKLDQLSDQHELGGGGNTTGQ